MSQWPSSKARRVLAALLRIGWRIKRESGSHKTLARLSKQTGLTPDDL
jgi:predicted RNA binding protein YcfA (HicA-like mRNA interferase family)